MRELVRVADLLAEIGRERAIFDARFFCGVVHSAMNEAAHDRPAAVRHLIELLLQLRDCLLDSRFEVVLVGHVPSVHEMGYNDRVRWLGLAILLAACDRDASYYHAPDPGNLVKDPYDFAAELYPRDLSASVFELLDMTMSDGNFDINASVDARRPDMINTSDNADLTHQ